MAEVKSITVLHKGIEFKYTVCPEANGVGIYRLEPQDQLATGATLKEACKAWLESYDDIDNLVVNMELWAIETGVTAELQEGDAAKITAKFDEFIESLSGEELFELMATDNEIYIDWSVIPVCLE